MKILRGQIFGFFIVLSGMLSLQGMMQQGAKLRRLKPRPVITQPMQPQPIEVNIPVQKPTTQTWKDWFTSLYTKPVGRPQQQGLWKWIKSLFVQPQKELLVQEPKKLEELPFQESIKLIEAPKKITPEKKALNQEIGKLIGDDHFRFDEVRLEKSKQLIAENREHFFDIIVYTDKDEHTFEGTIFDLVLRNICWSGAGSLMDDSWYKNSLKNYIQLAQYLISNGLGIASKEEWWYKSDYSIYLLSKYEKLYVLNNGDELAEFKKILEILDPIFEIAIPNSVDNFKQKRLWMARHPEETKKRVEHEDSRREYLWAKAGHLSELDKSVSEWKLYDKEKEQFDEDEYQAWLKYNSTYYGKKDFFPNKSLILARNKITELLGINANASEREIRDIYYETVRSYHVEDPNSALAVKVKNEIDPAWDEYNEALKTIKQEKINRE